MSGITIIPSEYVSFNLFKEYSQAIEGTKEHNVLKYLFDFRLKNFCKKVIGKKIIAYFIQE